MFKNSAGDKGVLCSDVSAACLAGGCLGHHHTAMMCLSKNVRFFNDSLTDCFSPMDTKRNSH